MAKPLSQGYGILPNEILYDQELSSSAKLLFVCISSHTAERGYCFATNKYMGEKLGVSARQIQRLIDELSAFIYVSEVNGKRRIELYPGDSDAWGVTKMSRGGDKNVAHNNTSNNKEKINKKVGELKSQLESIIALVNPKEKPTEDRQRLLNARLKEYSFGEIENAARAFSKSEWHRENGQMSIDNLLRPSKFGRWYTEGLKNKGPAKLDDMPDPDEQRKKNEERDWGF